MFCTDVICAAAERFTPHPSRFFKKKSRHLPRLRLCSWNSQRLHGEGLLWVASRSIAVSKSQFAPQVHRRKYICIGGRSKPLPYG